MLSVLARLTADSLHALLSPQPAGAKHTSPPRPARVAVPPGNSPVALAARTAREPRLTGGARLTHRPDEPGRTDRALQAPLSRLSRGARVSRLPSVALAAWNPSLSVRTRTPRTAYPTVVSRLASEPGGSSDSTVARHSRVACTSSRPGEARTARLALAAHLARPACATCSTLHTLQADEALLARVTWSTWRAVSAWLTGGTGAALRTRESRLSLNARQSGKSRRT